MNCTYSREASFIMYDSFLHVSSCVFLDPLLYTVQCAILHILGPKYFSSEKTSIRCETLQLCQKLDIFVKLVLFILYLDHICEAGAFLSFI